ncbi:unnamed protein product, partial [Choristocarpus tenellus]
LVWVDGRCACWVYLLVKPFRCLSRDPNHQEENGTILPQQDFHARRGIKPSFTFVNRVLAALAPMLQSILTLNSSPTVCAALNTEPSSVPSKHRTSFVPTKQGIKTRSTSHIRSPVCALIPTCSSHRQGKR